MGLDSVELLVSFEEYFGIQVADTEAEKIQTVQDMVDSVAAHLNVVKTDSSLLKDTILKRLNDVLIEARLINSPTSYADRIFTILKPDHEPAWLQISHTLGLKLPAPYIKSDGVLKKLVATLTRAPKYDWEAITTDQFITAICAANYEKLINRERIESVFEILIAIVAITVDRIGVDFYEVQPDKAFVKDLGID